ncbi:hypothetical protein KR222_002927 [Zaprionus bogoriensis]|nr:hypothetical protein KR222_002927 [Zaprionus bogoriensis]
MRKRMSSYAGACTATSLTMDVELTATEAELLERKSCVLWRHPLKTLQYSTLEVYVLLQSLALRLLDRRLVGAILIVTFVCLAPGPLKNYIQQCRQHLGFAFYWACLGFLSSVGFGTGLHTFLLYLGPHTAAVTLAAYECQTLDFPTPPYPEQKICPDEPYERHAPSVWNILKKVRVESLIWGVGTALGELPPYFMARAARLAGKNVEEWEGQGRLNLFHRSKLLVERVVLRTGFCGILLCASVPNPLFDLAGVACGHFLVPFWKFFVATMIGKAFFKVTLQQLIVIVAFSDELLNVLLGAFAKLPWIGPRVQTPIENAFNSTKLRMHSKVKEEETFSGLSLAGRIFQVLALLIVVYFVVSLLNALAKKHCKRLQEQHREKLSDLQLELQLQPVTAVVNVPSSNNQSTN